VAQTLADTAAADEVRRFQLHLIESGESICNRNRIMTGVRFLFRVTLHRHDLAAEVWHLKEPQKLPPVLSPEEVKRVLTMATSLKAGAMLTNRLSDSDRATLMGGACAKAYGGRRRRLSAVTFVQSTVLRLATARTRRDPNRPAGASTRLFVENTSVALIARSSRSFP
jgi:hypothetical protein